MLCYTINNMKRGQKQKGFTVVELLIVIVVIGILAAITIVAYNGIQNRAINSAGSSAAAQAVKLVNGYVSTYGTYPSTGRSCLTANSCLFGGPMTTNAIFKTEMQKIGTLPADVPTWNATYGGVMYDYSATRTYEGASAPAVVYFYQKGQRSCGMPVVAGASPNYVASTTGITSWVSSVDTTICIVHVPGPVN